MLKDFTEKSSKMVVCDNPPDWLIKIMKQFKGELTLVTSNKEIGLPNVLIRSVKSRFIIFDDFSHF